MCAVVPPAFAAWRLLFLMLDPLFRKQFRLINHNEYSASELESFVSIIHSNVLGAIRYGIRFAADYEIDLKGDLKSDAEYLLELGSVAMDEAVGVKVKRVWESDSFQNKVVTHEKFQIDDGALYFMGHVERIGAKGYVPTSQDILHARQKSTGIVETQFVSNNALFRIVDVGGQKSERKKWSVLFADITGIIFCADVSCYDTPLREDPNINRMVDSLLTFQSICSNRDLQSRDIILFLNKTDLLAKKLKRSPIPTDLLSSSLKPLSSPSSPRTAFPLPALSASPTPEEALKYIQALYLSRNENQNKFVYVHHTIATDTPNIKAVFTDIVKEIVRKDNVLASF